MVEFPLPPAPEPIRLGDVVSLGVKASTEMSRIEQQITCVFFAGTKLESSAQLLFWSVLVNASSDQFVTDN